MIDKPKFDPWARVRRAQESRRRANEDNKVYRRTRAVKKKLIAERGHKCQECGRTSGQLDAHHLIKIREGGANDGSNILLLCEACHMLEHSVRVRR